MADANADAIELLTAIVVVLVTVGRRDVRSERFRSNVGYRVVLDEISVDVTVFANALCVTVFVGVTEAVAESVGVGLRVVDTVIVTGVGSSVG